MIKLKGTYFLGRVIKQGRLDKDLLLTSLLNPKSVKIKSHAWTFIDVKLFTHLSTPFVVGKLSKYSPEGQEKVVQPDTHSEDILEVPNLSVASSSFIYIPKYSGIAYLSVARDIWQEMFKKRFSEIIEKTNDNFFVGCEIESVTDLQTFANKLKAFDGIYSISAKVVPPNPLFGPLWKSLKKYLKDRNLDSMELKEEAKKDQAIDTDLVKLVQASAEQSEDAPYIPEKELPITDAAVLMAADGYGEGKVTGKKNNKKVTIRTSESARNFLFDRDPDPDDFFYIVNEEFEKIEVKRHLKH